MRRLLLAAAAVLAGAAVLRFGGVATLEAWLPPFLMLLGLVVGALGALIAGRILGEDWLGPLRPTLAALARLAPLVLLLALPLMLAPGRIFLAVGSPPAEGPLSAWFAPSVFVPRVAVLLGAVAALALLVARPDAPRWRSALGLLLLVPAGMLLPHDLVLSREPGWSGSLQGVALFVGQLAAALSVAVLVALWRGGGGQDLRTTERALLSLILLTLWLWFVQFVVVWSADLPAEAAWYLRRTGGWAGLKAAQIAMLAVALLVAIPPRSGPKRLLAVSALFAAQHVAEVYWLLRPAAPVQPPLLVDGAIVVLLLALALGWTWAAINPPRSPVDAPVAKANGH